MKLNDVLRRECVEVNAEFGNKNEALHSIAQLAKKCPILKDVDQKDIFDGLEKREELGSTGFGKRIAIPHCRLKSVSDFVVGVITVPKGVDFNALDNKKVYLIVFIIGPEGGHNRHIRLLSAISQALLTPGVINEILAQKTPEGVIQSFIGRTTKDVDIKEQAGRNLLHVFVQDENTFRDILQVLAGVQPSSIVVLNAENAEAYLAKMPLFADFWSYEPSLFSKIIIAVVERGLTNEAVRRIESITGDLNKSERVMVAVQTISYSAGSLSMQL